MDFNEEEELQEEQLELVELPLEQESLEKYDSNEEDIINEDEPVPELDFSNSENFESPINVKKANTKKKNLSKLFVKKVLAIVVIILAIVVFVQILIYCFDFDIFGVGIPRPNIYTKAPSCGKVYLTWENESYTKARQKKEPGYTPITDAALVTDLDEEDDEYGERYTYKEYDYDTYVAGVIWTDNVKAKDIDNEIVYQAMAVAARSRLIAELPNNCVVLKNYNEQAQSFTELDGSEEKYTEITNAVRLSKGLIIARNGTAISAKYDIFSYVSKRMENDEQYKSIYFYHMMNVNKEKQQLIPADWVDNLEKQKRVNIPKLHVKSTKKLESMSLYGAKYLLEKMDSQYDLYRILETYYGRDIEYYTIDSAFSEEYGGIDGECSPISMTSTSLSREEFIKWAENYGNSHGGGAKTLAANAGMIYDMATSNGINPELVFVRADVEGYSPGASKNNYWGLGCTNTGGYDACISYSSLSEGVAGFLSFISKFGSLTDLMGKYAYLGDYWYNPGSWGTGGCVYASAIYGNNIPERVRNACAPGKTCTTAGGGDCVPTTDEDKQAYLLFQAQSMVSARKKIFGLDADICEPSANIGEPGSGACTIYRQGDSRWGNIKLGNSKQTISSSGCAVTSVAIAISCSGVQINNVAAFNPGTLVQRMNATGGFKGANIYWTASAINYFAPTFKYVKYERNISGTAESKINIVRNNMGSNISIILHFTNERHLNGHFVVLKSISGTNFTVYDPGNGKVNTYSANDLDGFVVYRY